MCIHEVLPIFSRHIDLIPFVIEELPVERVKEFVDAVKPSI